MQAKFQIDILPKASPQGGPKFFEPVDPESKPKAKDGAKAEVNVEGR